jgi:transposase
MPSLAEQAQAIADQYTPGVGRPSKLADDPKVQVFLEAVQDGNYIETACKLAEISKRTIYNWIERGRAGETAYEAFLHVLEKAEARAEADAIRNVRQAGKLPQFWAAEMTYLERRHPEKWGRRQESESGPKVQVIIGAGQAQVQIAVSPPTFAPDSPEEDSAKLLTGQAFALPSSPITAIMVTSEEACQSQAETPSDRQLPAGESPEGPSRVAAVVAPSRVPVRQRRRRQFFRAGVKRGPQ